MARRRTRRRSKKLLTLKRRRAIAQRMTWCVILLQAALILTLAVTPTDPPSGPHLLRLIWAWMHKPTFYPMVALLVGGPILTSLAWHTPGRHRRAIMVAWFTFFVILITCFGERSAVMLRILWWRAAG